MLKFLCPYDKMAHVMKKRVIALILAGMLLATGCGQSKDKSSTKKETTDQDAGSDATDTDDSVTDYKASDYVTLGKYKGVEVTLTKDYKDDDAAVKEYEETLIANAGGSYTKDESQKTVRKDSIVNVDYKGIKDGEAFEGGTATDVTIDVKNNKDATQGTGYIDGFTDGLVGAKVGETVYSKVTFPENYSSEELAGQEVTFQFKVNYICRKITADEVTTDFLKKNFSVDSKQAFYDYAKKKLQQENKTNKAQEAWSLVANAVEANAKVNSYPDGLIDKRLKNYKTQYARQNFTKGMTWKDFYKQYNVTEDQVNKQLKASVEDGVKQELIFNAIAEKEGIKVNKDKYATYLKNQMSVNGQSSEKSYYLLFGSTEQAGKEYVGKIYLAREAIQFCVDNATVNDKK